MISRNRAGVKPLSILALHLFLFPAFLGAPPAFSAEPSSSKNSNSTVALPDQSGTQMNAATDSSQAKPAALLRVGLLADAGCTDPPSRDAAWRILTAAAPDAGLEVRKFAAASTRSDGPDGLSSIDVLIFPGGTGNGQARALGVDGATRVTEFVRNGGGVIAICAGGYLVADGGSPESRAIELVNAHSWDDDHWARGQRFIEVRLVTGKDDASSATDGKATDAVSESDASSTRSMWFQNGPIFVPRGLDSMPAYTPLVRYVTDMAQQGAPTGMMTGRDAVIAAPFGKGRVVVFGPHPELSPELNHWLVNSVRWAGGGRAASADAPPVVPSVATVLEGR